MSLFTIERQEDREDSRTMFLSYTVQKEFEYSQAKKLNGIKLLNSQHIPSEEKIAINQNYPDQQRDDLPPPWILTLEIFNRNMSTIFQLKKKQQEIGLFVILNDGGEEIRHRYKKGQ